jgi:PilZ domain
MTSSNFDELPSRDRRRYPRYYVTSKLMLAIEDEGVKESLGIGEPGDISIGGVRVKNLPASSHVKVGDRLGLLLLDADDALSLSGEVVHHATADTFGVEFRELTSSQQREVGDMIGRLHARL